MWPSQLSVLLYGLATHFKRAGGCRGNSVHSLTNRYVLLSRITQLQTAHTSRVMDIHGHWSAPGECSKWRGAGNGACKWGQPRIAGNDICFRHKSAVESNWQTHKRELSPGWMIRRWGCW